MQRILLSVFLSAWASLTLAAENPLYFSCPSLDKRADDLIVIVDKSGGTASLQSEKSGSGLNFTSPASFGPQLVTWRNDSQGLAQKFSIDRTSLELRRESTFSSTGNTHGEVSPCTLIKPPAKTKF